jgi:predicted amidohydrolase YtcJ
MSRSVDCSPRLSVDDRVSIASTVAVKDGKIVAVGGRESRTASSVSATISSWLTRKGMSGAVLGAQEAVSIQDAIEPGKLADMIVLDADPLTIPHGALLKTTVDVTIVGGKVVYTRGGS